METIVFTEENRHKCKLLLSGRVLLIRLIFLIVTMELTSSELNFAHILVNWFI